MQTFLDRSADIQAFIDQYQTNIEVSKNYHHDALTISIKPQQSNQAPIALYVDTKTHYLSLEAGSGFYIDDVYWSDFPVGKVLAAIAAGRLVEYIRLVNNKKVGTSGYLAVDGESEPLYDNRTYSLMGELLYRFRKHKKEIRYAPYA